ncbi:major capsid protein [Paenibacillus larvae]|nr:major capsid protein [Paenibacillus larvae]MDT2292343.1 major capsid protein [Paenibacillus larvae]
MPDIFDLRTLIAAIRQMPPAQTFLGDLLFGEGKPFNTETVEVEYRKGKRKMAPFVSPLLPGKVTNREGYTVTMFKPALVKPLRPVTVIDLQKKLLVKILLLISRLTKGLGRSLHKIP